MNRDERIAWEYWAETDIVCVWCGRMIIARAADQQMRCRNDCASGLGKAPPGRVQFPVLLTHRERPDMIRSGCPVQVPWDMLTPHEPQARRNHDQSLAMLASRGGLGPDEILAVCADKAWRAFDRLTPEQQSVELQRAVAEWKATAR